MILAGLQGSGKVEIIEKKKEPAFPSLPAFLMDTNQQNAAAAAKAAAAVLSRRTLGEVGNTRRTC